MNPDPELESWKKEWQSLGGKERLAEELTARVAKDGRRLKLATVREIASASAGVLLCLWLIVKSRGEVVASVVCVALCLYFGIWVSQLLTLRSGSFRAVGGSIHAFVELTRRRLADDAKWASFRSRATQLISLFLVPWCIWAAIHRWPLYSAEPWRAIVGFGVPAVGFTWGMLWNRKKGRLAEAERERFEALVAERTLE
jgi:hypothetical protein